MPPRKRANPNQPTLPSFEGMQVAVSLVRLTKAGDGLSEALKVEPVALEIGDEVHYVVRAVCTGVNHKQDLKTGTLARIHTVEVQLGGIAGIDADIADKALAAAADRIEAAKASMAGQTSLTEPEISGDE